MSDDRQKSPIDALATETRQNDPLTAVDWLTRWDSGEIVPSVEMGGLGPAYEQCIHVTASEILRHLIKNQPDPDSFRDWWEKHGDAVSEHVTSRPPVEGLGITGAQWGAALNVAANLYVRGAAAFDDEAVSDRRIFVSRNFPSGEPEGTT